MTTHLLVAAAQQGPSPILQLMPLVLIFLVFYFVMWMPIRKQKKALEQLVVSLKKGDRVVTNGGLYGEVVKAEPDSHTVILKLGDNVKVKVAKRAIAGLEGSPEDKGAK
ncbi:MAG: preprotein translocase subunit YajC [bacterium]|nr:preprotein translocase subunit YajC [bacterium]